MGGAGQYTFSWRVFTSWDFTITENKTAKIKMKQHGIGMKEALFEASKKKEKDLKEKWVGIMALQIKDKKLFFSP